NASGGASIGFQSNAVLTIIDDDFYGSLSFAAPQLFINESAGNAVISVVRSGGSSDEVSVDFSVLTGTATYGLGYRGTNGTLTFANGVTNLSFVVPIINDNLLEAYETLTLLLTNFSKASAGPFTNITLTIIDDESLNVPAGTVNSGFQPGLNDSVFAI